MLYLQAMKLLVIKFVKLISKIFKIYKMESHKGNKEILKHSKIKNRTVDILMKFKPFRFQVKRVTEYDRYKKISVVTNDMQILLEGIKDKM